ncbi:MAG: glycosyltransferase family 2 protein [Kiritimatiellae bacterium]|nr:glycosyltransferase family 2 protein [Kiritimatiellia bacterium]
MLDPNSLSLCKELSVVIVTWNGDSLLKECLESIGRVYGSSLEIIVVDNADSQATRELVSSLESVRYVPSPGNPGFAGGNNIGVKATTRPYILLLNNDTVIHGDSFSSLVAFLKNHARAGIVQGTMNIPSLGNGLDDCGVMMTPFGIQRHLHRGEKTATAKLSPQKVFAAKGAMMMIKREALDELGFLFYDHFWSYYEETDFCHRARNAGWETWFVPTIPIDHLCGATSSKFDNSKVWRRYFRNILFSFWKNFGFFGRVFTLPSFACAAFIRSPSALCGAISDLISNRPADFKG